MLEQLSDVVVALKASFGVQVFANGEKFILIDETGAVIRDEMLTGVIVDMALTAQPRGNIIVPVSIAGLVEQVAARHQGNVIRTKSSPTALMLACQKIEGTILGGSADMGFIFPKLHPGFDAMFCIAKIIEWLTIQERTISQVRQSLPKFYHQSQIVRCPWSIKGALMRHLVESYSQKRLELVDGVKIFYSPNDWVLVLPDAGEPVVHIYANGVDNGDRDGQTWVEHHMQEFCKHIESFCKLQVALSKDTALLDTY